MSTTYFADFNGYYSLSERLLEGVTFRVELTQTTDSFEVGAVTPHQDAMGYLANVQWDSFANRIKALAEINLAHLTQCATKEGTTLKALFDEFAAETGGNGGQLLSEV